LSGGSRQLFSVQVISQLVNQSISDPSLGQPACQVAEGLSDRLTK
jgi:hypothetical protein